MTVEKRVRVGIGDIKDVTAECGHCQARLTFKPQSNFVRLSECANCGKHYRASDDDVRFKLIRMIGAMQELTKPNEDFSLSLELDDPERARSPGAPSML